jgi:quercetin dioxygenase-like cupin family protein
MTNTLPELKAFKRAPSLGLSQWENGNLTTNLAEKKDTNGAFFLVEAMLAPGTEPPPRVHTHEDELFYVLEGEFDVYVGEEAFKVLPTGAVTYSTGDLKQTAQRLNEYGARFLTPAEVADQLPLYPKRLPANRNELLADSSVATQAGTEKR